MRVYEARAEEACAGEAGTAAGAVGTTTAAEGAGSTASAGVLGWAAGAEGSDTGSDAGSDAGGVGAGLAGSVGRRGSTTSWEGSREPVGFESQATRERATTLPSATRANLF